MRGYKPRPEFWTRLDGEIEGGAAGDIFSRGRYATDASIYQCFPAGVAWPKHTDDLAIIVEMAREEGLSLVPRGGGTSTAGQALGEGLVVDFSRYCTRIENIDVEQRVCIAEPGATPAAVNAMAKAHGLLFPVGITSGRVATIGGMLANNSSGLRSLRYGAMADNVKSVQALLADGQKIEFATVTEAEAGRNAPGRDRLLDLLQFGELNESAIRALDKKRETAPRMEGYDLRALLPAESAQNLVRIAAGSEGTLAFFAKLELKLVERPRHRALGVCRLTRLDKALGVVPAIVGLGASAVELVDGFLLDFIASAARSDPQAARVLQGAPAALLLVEFDDANPVENTRKLKALDDCLADAGQRHFGVAEIIGENAQARMWRLRRNALIQAMALKTAGQPVSFLEDGAVPLAKLPAYAAALEKLFGKHGLRAVIWGSAGHGALQVRPILDLRHHRDLALMRELNDEMVALLHKYGGSLTSGYGVGIARSEAVSQLRGGAANVLSRQVKAILDPDLRMNPGKLIDPPGFSDAVLLRVGERDSAFLSRGDAGSALQGGTHHAERCSGLSLCRSSIQKAACPSYAVTGEERDSPRGRANSVRLALSGELGQGAFTSEAMFETMRLCVSCKICKTACPASIDIPRMKVEVLAAARREGKANRPCELYARLPQYTDRARRLRSLLYLRELLPGLPRLSERFLGLAADRAWPRWSGRPFRPNSKTAGGPKGKVALIADTFNRSFEPANLRAASNVLAASGYGVVAFQAEADAGGIRRPLCCGRTFYDAGYADEAREEAVHFARALSSFAEQGIAAVGLEPLCVLMARDEYAGLGVTVPAEGLPLTFEEFALKRHYAGDFDPPLKSVEADIVLHSHCHERFHGVNGKARQVLELVPGLAVKDAPPSCCGLNGLTGMTPDTFEPSLAMAERALFPAIRNAGRDALIAATGYSCRKQIHDGLGRVARHPVTILDLALRGDAEIVS